MKKAVFVYNPRAAKQKHEQPWKRPGEMTYNSKAIGFEPGGGQVIFRLGFDRPRGASAVRVRATALGIFELYLNGDRVGHSTPDGYVYDELKPTWTDYRSRVFEYEYDLAAGLKEENVLVAVVSPGWWSGRISFGIYGYQPSAFCGEVEVSYPDGKSEIISEGWRTATGGPVRRADIWDGEYYDARCPDPTAQPEEFDWSDALPFVGAACEIVKPVGGPIRRRADLARRPISTLTYLAPEGGGEGDFGAIIPHKKRIGDECEAGVLAAGDSMILDFGQNMVGRPRIEIRAARGTKICGYFAEMLNDTGLASRGNDGPRGSLYIKNYRSALSRMTYVAAGEGVERYTPLHTFYGFRYLELTSDADIEVIGVAGEVISSDMRESGHIETDNPEVNRLISNILWGMRGNYLSVPTDCPQRDERLGWSGDTQIFCGAASYFCDVRAFFKKWLGDARDSQSGEGGAYCDVIPRVFVGRRNGNAAWGDAGLIVPHRLWLMYRDLDTLREHYDSMEEYMRYLEGFGLEGPNTAYGDWLNYENTDKRYIAVCYYAGDAALMAEFSRILGKPEREDYYYGLRRRIGEHFAEKYIALEDLTERSQTAYLLALKFDLLPENMRDRAIAALERKIIDNNYTLSTGFVGTGILNQTLSAVGLDKLCYSLLLQTADPSWLYSVRQGATTVWERWNSYTLERGFGDVGMNSFNHYAYGAVAEWMFSRMAGISPDPERPGFENFILCPRPDMREEGEIPEGQERIRRVRARYDSGHGRIESGWDYERGGFSYRFVIPEGTEARLELPVSEGCGRLLINGVIFTPAELGGGVCGGILTFALGAGSYLVREDTGGRKI